MGCDDLIALRGQRNEAIDAVYLLANRRVSDTESQVIYAHLTLAHKAEVQHRLECPECAGRPTWPGSVQVSRRVQGAEPEPRT
jgi:hypothetical protein